MKKLSLSNLLRKPQLAPSRAKAQLKKEIKSLQLDLLRIQQGIWHGRGRAILVFEGFDAAGKGGAIRTITECLDPRGVSVHPIGPPLAEERENHWLYRFWKNLPPAGGIAIFDRSWYGRVLVEKVEALAPAKRIRQAYHEINQFEETLRNDGIVLMKFFLAISKEEQLERFRARLKDPYKNWKLTEADIRARKKRDEYVAAVDKLLQKTHSRGSPWHLIPADHKTSARLMVLREATRQLAPIGHWMETKAAKLGRRSLREELRKLGIEERSLI